MDRRGGAAAYTGGHSNAANIRVVKPQMHFSGSPAEIAETLRAITSAAAAQPGVNIVLEQPQIYFGSASSIQQQQQQQQYLMKNQASHMAPHSQQYIHGTTAIAVAATAPGGPRMLPDPPRFDSAFIVPGLDFGFELAQRRAFSLQHVDTNFHLVLYTQSPGSQAAQSVLRVMSAGMSTKRSKHVIFMFDHTTVNYQSFKWPDRVRLEEVKHKLIKHVIGQEYDLCRKKVRKDSFTLYLYGVKRRLSPFSQSASNEWATLVYWADSQIGEIDGVSLSDQLAKTGSMLFNVGGMVVRPLLLGN